MKTVPDEDDDLDPREPTTEIQIPPTVVPPRPVCSYRMLVLEGPEAGQSFAVDGVITLGRGEDCDVRLTDSSISRHHARLGVSGKGLYVEDLGSRNGTFASGELVSERRWLGAGERLGLGAKVLLLVAIDDPLEAQLRQRQKMEAIGRIAAGVAHDFNNLVGAALGAMDTLDERLAATLAEDSESAACIEDLRLALTRASELTRSLATLGRRKNPTRPTPVDVGEVCHEVVRLCQRTFGVDVEVAVEAAENLLILGNRTELHQVLLNLCLNARDAMKDGGVVSVRARRHGTDDPASADGRMTATGLAAIGAESVPDGATDYTRHRSGPEREIIIEVSDSGAGMDADTLAHIFEPFFTTKSDGRGSGLGLATVSELVRGMGGQIHASSRPGQGSTFVVALPALRTLPTTPRPDPKDRAAPSLRSFPRLVETERRGRILVVDDQELMRRSLARLMRSARHETLMASCGADAMALWRRTHPRPEVIVADLDMPNGTGADIIREAQTLSPRPEVIIVSGHWDPTLRRRLMHDGAAAVLQKPVDAEELRSEVRLALSRYDARRKA